MFDRRYDSNLLIFQFPPSGMKERADLMSWIWYKEFHPNKTNADWDIGGREGKRKEGRQLWREARKRKGGRDTRKE